MKYVIVNRDDVTDAMVEASVGNSLDDMRSSVYGNDRVILKFQGDAPESVSAYTKYTHSQIKDIVEDPDGDWIPFEDIDEV